MKTYVIAFLGAALVAGPASANGNEPSAEASTATSSAESVWLEADGAASPAPKATSGEDLRVFWKDGLKFESEDGQFKLNIGGRIFVDAGWFGGDGYESGMNAIDPGFTLDDGVEFRAARVRLEGWIYEDWHYKGQYDFAGGDADFKDVFIERKNLGFLGSVRVGHFKEPFSLERMTSSRFITFMERATADDAFSPDRNTGIMVHNTCADKRVTWALGGFKTTNDYGNGSGDGDYAITGRVTGLPMYNDNGRQLVHVGGGFSYRSDDTARYRTHPEAHLVDYVVDTNFTNGMPINADGIQLLNGELAWVQGPVSLQGEYYWADVDQVMMPSASFSGYYAQASYFLTGEHRAYKQSSGAFDRIKPTKAGGAWELAARYSMTDLNDGGVTGGEVTQTTFGINWYTTPNTRIMLNYVYSDLDQNQNAMNPFSDTANFLMLRFQVDF